MSKRKRARGPSGEQRPAVMIERPSTENMRASHWFLWIPALLLFALGIIPTANLVTTGGGLPWWSHAVQEWLLASGMIMSAVLLLSYAFGGPIERVAEWGSRILARPTQLEFESGVATLAVVFTSLSGWLLFRNRPVTGDEFAQRFQSHLLAGFHLSATVPRHPEFFSTTEALMFDGKWFSQFPVGGPLLLAIGERLGAVWLINPLLTAIACVAVYRFVRVADIERNARITALLMLLSPFVIFMGGSQMNHTSELALLWIALAALARWSLSSSQREAHICAVILGLSLGFAAAVRPFDAAVTGVSIGCFVIWSLIKRREDRVVLLRSLATMSIATCLPISLLFVANIRTLGGPLSFGYDVLNGPEHRPGFHMTPLGFEHTPLRALYMASAYLMKLDVGLLTWPVPAVLLPIVTMLLVRRPTRWDVLVSGMLVAMIIGYACYWSESYFIGPRFLFNAAPIFLWFTARATALARERVRQPVVRIAILCLVPAWIGVAVATPERGDNLIGIRQQVALLRRPSTAHHVIDALRAQGVTRAVVFLNEGLHARLTARLRSIGLRPLAAEQLVSTYDACRVDSALTLVESIQSPAPRQQLGILADMLDHSPRARQLVSDSPSDQLALIPDAPRSAHCDAELKNGASNGLNLAELLPFETFERNGDLGGDLIFARDFAERNARLRDRFGDRPWIVARAVIEDRRLRVHLAPYR